MAPHTPKELTLVSGKPTCFSGGRIVTSGEKGNHMEKLCLEEFLAHFGSANVLTWRVHSCNNRNADRDFLADPKREISGFDIVIRYRNRLEMLQVDSTFHSSRYTSLCYNWKGFNDGIRCWYAIYGPKPAIFDEGHDNTLEHFWLLRI